MRTFKNENNRGFTSVPVPMTITNKIKQFRYGIYMDSIL